MEIFWAESLGFCMGGKRAVDMAYRARGSARGLPVVSLGPLIHNEQETARLAADGIALSDTQTLPAQGTVLVRAHGVTPQALADLQARGLRVMDDHCPSVSY